MRFEITPKMFYQVGLMAFSIITLMNLLSLIVSFSQYNTFSLIAGLSNIAFTGVLALFFYSMLRNEPKITNEVASDDINEVIKKLKAKDI